MKDTKKLIWFLFLNAVVSAATVIVAMHFWTRANPCYSLDDARYDELTAGILGNTVGAAETQGVQPGSSGEQFSGLFSVTMVVGAGDLGSEYVVIRYMGEEPVSLQGWKMINQNGLEFIFPNVRLLNNTDMRVYSAEGTNSVNGLYWNAGEAVWASGSTVSIYDPEGLLQAQYVIP